MALTAGDFRNGMTVLIDGDVCQIIEFQHVKPGKGAAFVRTKYRKVIAGGVVETSFNPTAKFDEARIERTDMQYLYSDDDMFYFMNNDTYEQIGIERELCADALKFVKENENVKVLSFQEKPFSIEPPLFVTLQITSTEPGFKGNTATGASKPAIVETGAQIAVPLFIEEGEMVKVDTRTGEYLGRANN